MWRRLVLVSLALLAWQDGLSAQHPRPDIPVQVGPRTTPAQERGRTIPGRFVVTLQERVDPRRVAADYGVPPDHVYTRVLTGFAGVISEAARAGLLRDNRVVRVEPDRPARASQVNSWGLDRIDERSLPLDGLYGVAGSGSGVTVYVVDTGIRFDHQEFGGRAVRGFDAIGDGRNGADCNGHGTHVAGTIGGRSYGVAREVRLVSARVLDCEGSGTMSGVIAALDWIATYAARPAVVNMSLGGDPHSSTDDAVRRLVSAGFPIMVAAGNDGADACLTSPSRVAEAFTLAATDNTDTRPSWSNYGSCVDLFAPGVSIPSAWYTSTTALASASGTSMATPHAAGAAALILEDNPQLLPAAIADAIVQAATKDVVRSAASARDHLLYTAPAAGSTPTVSPDGVTINGTTANDVITPTRTVAGQPLPTSGDDTIYGRGGSDYIDGGAGADRMVGGSGNDQYVVDNVGDEIVEAAGAGADTVYSSVSFQLPDYVDRLTLTGTSSINGSGNFAPNRIIGNGAANSLSGGTANDVINGGAGSDYIYGGPGDDVLTGGTGNDRFYMTGPLGTGNVDRIIDFSPPEDMFRMLRTAFVGIAERNGTLTSAAFREGTAAADSSDRIIYNRATGEIFFDSDGSGRAAAILFATVRAGTALTNADFVVYG